MPHIKLRSAFEDVDVLGHWVLGYRVRQILVDEESYVPVGHMLGRAEVPVAADSILHRVDVENVRDLANSEAPGYCAGDHASQRAEFVDAPLVDFDLRLRKYFVIPVYKYVLFYFLKCLALWLREWGLRLLVWVSSSIAVEVALIRLRRSPHELV